MWPMVGMSWVSPSIQAWLVFSYAPVRLACAPVHIVARDGVQIGTVQYCRSKLTPCASSRSIVGQLHVRLPLVHAQDQDVRSVRLTLVFLVRGHPLLLYLVSRRTMQRKPM